MNPIEAAGVLEEYAARLDRAGMEQWYGEINPGAEETAALRNLADRLRESGRGTTLGREDIRLLDRHARELRGLNEPLTTDSQISESGRREAFLALGVASQFELLSTWILDSLEGRK